MSNNQVSESYVYGFVKRCEEDGIDPEALAKAADDGILSGVLGAIKRPFYTGKNPKISGKAGNPAAVRKQNKQRKAKGKSPLAATRQEAQSAAKKSLSQSKTKQRFGESSQAAQRKEELAKED